MRCKVAGVLPHDQVVVDDMDLPSRQRRTVGLTHQTQNAATISIRNRGWRS